MLMANTSKRFKVKVTQDDDTTACGIELPFDPKGVWGKVRMPVVAKINAHSFRTTVCSMGGAFWIPLNKENREAAGTIAGKVVEVVLTPDGEPRVVKAPKDLLAVLRKTGTLAAWETLSFTHQREHVEAIEEAKKPETRARRIERAVEMVAAKAAAAKGRAKVGAKKKNGRR